MKVSNLTDIPQQVGIILADGRRTTVRVMSRHRRVDLPKGAVLDPRWVALNPRTVAAFPTAEEIQEQTAQKGAKPSAPFQVKQNIQAKE